MAATATLSTTTLLNPASSSDSAVQLVSTDGVLPGLYLYIDHELMKVVSLGLSNAVNVLRGQSGTASTDHAIASVATLGRGDQFYDSNPVGMPPASIPVSPWINVQTGEQWVSQGDESGSNASARYWLRVLHTHGIGAFGVRTDAVGVAMTTVS